MAPFRAELSLLLMLSLLLFMLGCSPHRAELAHKSSASLKLYLIPSMLGCGPYQAVVALTA